jgi:hypothetical protein
MIGLAAGVVLQLAVVATGAQPYGQAQKSATENGKPLLVLVGTEWCPGCRTMKNGVMARMESGGRLRKVNYAIVNPEDNLELGSRLMRGNSVPQLIVFSKRANGEWHREQITGAASEAQVAAMIARAEAAQAKTTAAGARPVSGIVGGQ